MPDLLSLKVADLKRILAAANVRAPARATKADLVARIHGSTDAQNAYRALFLPPDTDPVPSPSPPPPQPPPPPPQQPENPLSPEELELEKRKARAARFGIPLVEPAPPGDQEKLKARAKRFGIDSAADTKKRSAPGAAVDPEELEKRKKRAERFSTKPPGTSP